MRLRNPRLLRALESWAMKTMFMRNPDITIGDHDDPYMERWHILPRNPFFNLYLHRFLRDDDDRALHDHPWASASLLIAGSYVEVTPWPDKPYAPGWGVRRGNQAWRYLPGDLIFRSATHAHRIELLSAHHCVTLFATGPRVRDWGFHCPKGWRNWREFEDHGCD